ncbi:unnamed protein product [Didymodactylos carnosus]|uniref:Uncharacterized protein n=1 Tax=Didymodactylos carnosus TaxID=1234261 RepID=A0A8S2K7D9_9BILA|nr:unnamed protein product [Didymodactylos carnosus]CAF3840416.1 unnamed protein product [Didymodactylos carnosus]
MPTRSSQTHVVSKPKLKLSKNIVIGDSTTRDLVPKHICTTQHQAQVKTRPGSNINRLHEQSHNGDFYQLLPSSSTATFVMGTINLSTEPTLQTIEHTESFILSFDKLHPNVKLFILHVPYRFYGEANTRSSKRSRNCDMLEKRVRHSFSICPPVTKML